MAEKPEDQKTENGSSELNIENSLNIKHDVSDILRTLLLLDESPGLSYLIKILRGSDVEWITEDDTRLETFGIMCGHPHDRIRIIVNYMMDRGYIQPNPRTGNTLEITASGRAYLDQPADLFVSPGFVRSKRFDWVMRRKLWELRRDISQQGERAAYQVMSELTIERLVRLMPVDLAELQEIPGMTEAKIEEFGHALLQVIDEVREMRKEASAKRMEKIVKARTYQETKQLFEQGKSIEEISEEKGVKDITVLNYLMRLHRTKEIDLKPWIEENLDSEELYRASEYFKGNSSPKLKEAHELLNIPYSTLRLAKLYILEILPEMEKEKAA